MGELKDVRNQQDSLVERAREINRKIWLAGLGAVSKAEEESRKQLDKYVSAGERAIGGEGSVDKNRYLVAARGLVVTLREESDSFVDRLVKAGRTQQGDKAEQGSEYVLALIGAYATVRDESQRIFDDLVASGEKRRGPQP